MDHTCAVTGYCNEIFMMDYYCPYCNKGRFASHAGREAHILKKHSRRQEVINDEMKKKHGGKRKGAGRPKGKVKEETVVIRVRKSKLEEVKKVNSEK